jgi:hypothetical protein
MRQTASLRPSFEFTPRAYMAQRQDGADFRFALDWDSFWKTGRVQSNLLWPSDFTQSLNDILVKVDQEYCPTSDCVSAKNTNYLVGPAYNALLLDVNSDGLPDVVAAGKNPLRDVLDLATGHDVFLNRGYRFGIPNRSGPVPERGLTSGPFTTLQKGELPESTSGGAISRGNHLPAAATAFVDINADGRLDVVFWARTFGSNTEATPTVWVNDGDRFSPLPAGAVTRLCAAGETPPCPLSSLNLRLADVEPPGAVGDTAKTMRGFSAADLARLQDVDDDGLVDIVVPGVLCLSPSPQHCKPPPGNLPGHWQSRAEGGLVWPAYYLKNLGRHPDLLVGISDNRGNSTTIAYENARTSGRVTTAFVPAGMQLVSAITSRENPSQDQSVVDFRYSDWVRSESTPESIGFTKVSAIFTDYFEGARVAEHSPTRTRVYDVDPGTDIPYPKRGLVVSDQYDADGQRGLTTTRWGLTRAWGADLKAVRLDKEETTSEECLLGTGTTPTCIGAPVKSYTLVKSRDSHGYPTLSLSGDADEKVTIVNGRIDLIGSWILGLVTEESTQGRRYRVDGSVQEESNISTTITAYNSMGRMLTRTAPHVAPDACVAEVGALVDNKLEIQSFDAYGNVVTAVQNGLTTTRTYDDFFLHPKTVTATVTAYVDGVAGGQSVLTSSRFVDLRTGELWSAKDANGALSEVRRDARGRPTVEVFRVSVSG